MEPRVGNKFRLGRKIGSGSFGEIYLGSSSSPLQYHLFDVFIFLISSFLWRFWAFGWLCCLFCMLSSSSGTNIQTNEEVAIKLVSIFFSQSFPNWGFCSDLFGGLRSAGGVTFTGKLFCFENYWHGSCLFMPSTKYYNTELFSFLMNAKLLSLEVVLGS